MKIKNLYIYIILLLYSFTDCQAQENKYTYHLAPGEKLYLEQSLKQRTESENQGIKGSVNLDISSRINVEIIDINKIGYYVFKCQYNNLDLSFFSPGSTISINSKSNIFNPIISYLRLLEKENFHFLMSPTGEIVEILQLDSIINSFYNSDIYDALKHDVLIKTVKEGFGEDALRGLLNIALNIYIDQSMNENKKYSEIYFNAKILSALNRFYYQTDSNNNFRVQGIGIIEKDEEQIDLEDFSMKTVMRGDQTYDYVVDPGSGWIIKGVSKQNIQSLTVLENYKGGPEGLKIPSMSKTEYQFTGGKIINQE